MNSNEQAKPEMDGFERGRHGRNCRHGFGRHGGRKRWIAIPFFIAGFILLKSAAVMLIWNALIPDLFHGPEITYLQALGLSVLAKLLVGFGGGRGPGGFGRHHGPPWMHGHGRFAGMSREDREKLREHFSKARK